tara:strand:- start:75 stop:506 length:432 start_codon:yes stop_codon:yes gene_type:complete
MRLQRAGPYPRLQFRPPKILSVEPPKRPAKYRNIKTTVDGLEFDSRAEATRYRDLCVMQSAGEISDLELQPRIELVSRFKDAAGKTHKAVVYIGDFSYTEKGSDRPVIEDVKGVQTPVFRLKRRLMLQFRPALELRIIGRGDR